MLNPYQTELSEIIKIKKEGADSLLLTLSKEFNYQPGQFIMVSLPGFSESAISLCASNEICVKKAGATTAKLHHLKKGDKISVRGPYGHGWPKVSGKLLLVAGGLGLAPFRPLVKRQETILFYGACREKDLIFSSEYCEWHQAIDIYLVLEEKPNKDTKCDIGLVTDLFEKVNLPKDITAFLCGPPIMYKFVIEKLKKHQVSEENIYLSLERQMYCGVGVCQHCAVGTKYTCADGPVFNLKDIKSQPF